MAGHSQFSNIKHRKSAQDQKRSKKFTKISREILVAAKSGSVDTDLNPKLRSAVNSAKRYGFPKDRIDEAIKKACSKSSEDNYEEVVYEGYGAYGVAIIIKSLTNNRNRTASDLRFIFSRSGGSLGETGSVNFLFENLGEICYPSEGCCFNGFFDYGIEVEALNVIEEDGYYKIICDSTNLGKIKEAFREKFGDSETYGLFWKPTNTLSLNTEQKDSILNLFKSLEGCDDVQYFESNVNKDD